MIRAHNVAALGSLIYCHEELIPLLEEHLEDNEGEFLPHLVMSDIIRWMIQHFLDQEFVCRSIVAWLERAYVRGPETVREMIVVSGLEMFPNPNEDGFELWGWLGPELRKYCPWTV